MDTLSVTESSFLELDRDHQNELLSPIIREGRLISVLAEALKELPWDPENETFQDLWLALSSLKLFESRISGDLIRPLVRVYLAHLADYRAQGAGADEDLESIEEIWTGIGLPIELLDDPNRAWGPLIDQIILQAGQDWHRAMGFIQGMRRLAGDLDREIQQKLLSVPALIVLSSKPNRRALDLWRDTWNRTSYQSSDLFYHDSRLRRALLDENVDHAYRLMGVLAKSGEKSTELVSGVIRAGYDIDFVDDETALGIFVGASGLLESAPFISGEHFRLGVAKILYTLASGPKRPNERIFYDEISLIKSREILIDFRKAMLRSDFLQAWGYAEYAFVHGLSPLELFDELVRLSPSFYQGGPELLWAWKHLGAVEAILRLLPEDYGIYVMAQTVRVMARSPKDVHLLDPFPDEDS